MSISHRSGAEIRLRNRDGATIGLSRARGDIDDPTTGEAGVRIPSERFLINNLLVVFPFLRLAPLERRGLFLERSGLSDAIGRVTTIGMKGLILCDARMIMQQCAVIDLMISSTVEAGIFMAS